MPDYGAMETDALLAKMEKRMGTVYSTAEIEMKRKLRQFMKKYNEDNKAKQAALKAGDISKEQYQSWKESQASQKRWLNEMVNTLSEDATMTDMKAMSVVRGFMPEAYALNRNYGAFQVEQGALVDTSFTLYDAHTVERIVEERPNLLPQPKPDIPKEMRWHKQKINNAIVQGILQGEAIPDIAKRLQEVTDMDKRAAIRNARTATTAAQNAGRVDSYKDAQKMGINLKQQWVATLDGRTRHSHRDLDGEIREVGEQFSNGCEYPGDPKGDGSEIYNCRCTLIAAIKGFERDLSDLGLRHDKNLGNMSYEEWKNEKENKLDQKSLFEQLANGEITMPSLSDAFDGFVLQTSWNDDPEIAKGQEKIEAINNTIALMQERFPMQHSGDIEYFSTANRVVICDYKNASNFLPNGPFDRRLDNLATAQVFRNDLDYLEKNQNHQAVIGFNRSFLSSNVTMSDALASREKHIANGEIIYNLGGGTPEAVAIHEWGHVYQEHIATAMINGSETAQEYWKWYQTLTKDEIMYGISEYAATNRGEFEAECFLEMQMPNPRPLAQKWWEYAQKVVEEGY